MTPIEESTNKNQTNIWTKIIGIGIVLFLVWAWFSNQRANREERILYAVEQACEEMFPDIDSTYCFDLGYDVVEIYRESGEPDPRAFSE